MSIYQSDALTLRTYPYGEGHKIAVFLTRKHGIVRGAAHGAQSGKSRFGSALEPLTHLRLTFRQRENQDLATIQSCEIIRPFAAFGLNLEQSLHLSYFAELLSEFGQEMERDERVFRLALAVLDACQRVPVVGLARYLELWLLQLEGILPALDRLLPQESASKTREMMKRPPAKLSGEEWQDQELKSLGRLTNRLIESHLEKRLKTRKMLEEML